MNSTAVFINWAEQSTTEEKKQQQNKQMNK